MNSFDNTKYESEVKERFCETEAYKEFECRSAKYTKEDYAKACDGLDEIFKKFAVCKEDGNAPDSVKAQSFVEELKSFITSNFYTCTDEIIKGLGLMYVNDQRFKENIDKHGDSTAEFVSQAIEAYCK